ncbi:MAG: nucleotidyltransferase [Opitutus sp.]|nr:nucleotidyltransferase [Opitutus sp.]
MPTVKHAVIAVAGLGSRLGHGKPKCLVEVAGRRILEWQLELLRAVPDVRLVVGYLEHEVIEAAFKLRRDLTIVRNPAYRTTTTQQSYWLGARFLEEPCLYLDGDIIFERESFHAFLTSAATRAPLIGVTQAKTEQAVFAATEAGADEGALSVTGFSRTERSLWEWANVACLPPGMLQENGRDVFSRLALHTPLPAQAVECFEVDTEADLVQAREFVNRLQARPEAARNVA